MPPKQPGKMRCLQAAKLLRQGALLAHHTATLPGIAAVPDASQALQRLRQFKQRQGPFLMLIASPLCSRIRARRWIVWRSRTARQWMRDRWPGTTTLLLPASNLAPSAAVARGAIALRMVEDVATRQLLRQTGGALYSSSLNRQGAQPRMPSRPQRWRWHRFHLVTLQGPHGCGKPSALINLCRTIPKRLR